MGSNLDHWLIKYKIQQTYKSREIKCLLSNTSKAFPTCGPTKTGKSGLHWPPIRRLTSRFSFFPSWTLSLKERLHIILSNLPSNSLRCSTATGAALCRRDQKRAWHIRFLGWGLWNNCQRTRVIWQGLEIGFTWLDNYSFPICGDKPRKRGHLIPTSFPFPRMDDFSCLRGIPWSALGYIFPVFLSIFLEIHSRSCTFISPPFN